MPDDIKPCPFCGSSDRPTLIEACGEFWVLCTACRSHAGASSNERDGIAAWNRREAAA
jgi:Lar family restriction alleviation protein